MRKMLGGRPLLQVSVQYAVAGQHQTVPVATVSTRKEATAILGGPIPGPG
jgi:hypothetical protein